MRPVKGLIVVISALATLGVAAGQDKSDDNARFNSNLGFNISAPLSPMGRFAGAGAGMTYGAGYNFSRRHSVMGEFMWDWLNPGSSTLTPIQIALRANNISAHSNLYALTANYRFELRGHAVGTYFIVGTGWYLRRSSLTKLTVTGTNITCTPVWLWWGATCNSGVVTANQTIASVRPSALGANVGIGFTARVGDAPYRVYVETRYHYAPTKNINTQLITITLGFSWQ